MTYRILLVLLLVCAVAGDCSAQAKPGGVARQIAMGGASFSTPSGTGLVFNPFIFDDPSWSLINPAYVGLYRDYLWLNVAGGGVLGANGGENVAGNQFGGFGIGFGNSWVVGATLSYDPSYANALVAPTGVLRNFVNLSNRPILLNPAYATVPTGTLGRVEVIELVTAYRLPGLTLGGAVMYGWTNKDFKLDPAPAPPNPSEGEVSANVFGVRLGAYADLGGGNTLEGSAALRFSGATDKYTVGGTGAGTGEAEYTASATEMLFTLRARLKASQKVSFVPYGAFRTISAEPKEDGTLQGQVATPISSLERTITTFAVGGGIEYTSKVVFLAAGLSFVSDKTTDEGSRTTPTALSQKLSTGTRSFPVFNIGAEFPLATWLQGRVGYYRAFANSTYKSESTTTTTTTVEGNLFAGTSIVGIGGYGPIPDNSLLTLGLGITVDAFALDATVSEEALRRGLGLIGASDNINTFGYLTLSFTFE